MIDIHTHILPGVDDGVSTMEDSMKMAMKAVKDGTRTVVATPHHNNGSHYNYKNNILLQVNELNRQLNDRDIPLTVLPGQETRVYGDILEGLQKDEILTINESDYVFIELPRDHFPQYLSNFLFNLQVEGYRPILTHPERNTQIIEQPNLLYSLVKNGAFVQITASSLLGKYGRNVKKLSYQLIDSNLVHLIASGAQKSKVLNLKEAYRDLKKNYDQSMVYYFSENAQYVVEGQSLATEPPERIKKKKILGVF
ncbi:tyrosine protein phosphatase [Halobacillus shinanisalinarum]|uniref:Tyrosine-protein phosphatase n=1 Tax=Halobacillus shinanisalinarum TaxID=2932258 RepID=A0ABY4H7F5_9BACI|nr:CpsB/CapC family capsule biosynthesis tyrosine phosphatase [Halobacillus shinanisalinarum]UOQ94912.1 tyrosine protein phosphatase [Halobacillus shinanisalinarum]